MMQKKIGMCCACGGSFPKSKTVFINGIEYCPNCAEMTGQEIDLEDEEDE